MNMKWTDAEILAAAEEQMKRQPKGEALLLDFAGEPITVKCVKPGAIHGQIWNRGGFWRDHIWDRYFDSRILPTPAGEAWLVARRERLSATDAPQPPLRDTEAASVSDKPDLSRWLLPDGTARTGNGVEVSGLECCPGVGRLCLIGKVRGDELRWMADGRSFTWGPDPSDIIPAFSDWVQCGRPGTLLCEVKQTGDGEAARTHFRCTFIDERLRGKRWQGCTMFKASNDIEVGSFTDPDIKDIENAKYVWVRGDDESLDAQETETFGHRAAAIFTAVNEAAEAWGAELQRAEAEAALEILGPKPGDDSKAATAQLRAEMDDLKQEIREFGTRMHQCADQLLRAGRRDYP